MTALISPHPCGALGGQLVASLPHHQGFPLNRKQKPPILRKQNKRFACIIVTK